MSPTASDWQKALRVMRQIYRVYSAVELSRGRGEAIRSRIVEAGQAIKSQTIRQTPGEG